jgi:hypothetical protein
MSAWTVFGFVVANWYLLTANCFLQRLDGASVEKSNTGFGFAAVGVAFVFVLADCMIAECFFCRFCFG